MNFNDRISELNPKARIFSNNNKKKFFSKIPGFTQWSIDITIGDRGKF